MPEDMKGDKERTSAAPPVKEVRRRRLLRDILVTIGIALLILVGVVAFNLIRGGDKSWRVVAYAGGIPTGSPPKIGSPPPQFEIPLMGGGTFSLAEHTSQGHTVWINFWASWCPPCRAEMPDIQKVWEEEQAKGDQGVALVAIDFGESAQDAADYVLRNGFTFPIGWDPGGRVATEYRLSGLPSHFLIDKNGVLREIRIGLLSLDAMRQRLGKLRSY